MANFDQEANPLTRPDVTLDGHTTGRGPPSSVVCSRHGRMTTGIRMPSPPLSSTPLACVRVSETVHTIVHAGGGGDEGTRMGEGETGGREAHHFGTLEHVPRGAAPGTVPG